ncbi:MAG: hypothetical protein BGO67_12490 [Alphaproteobacteria bacterium 41-28]|nr:MAG: hypothetical protein BGO67_12490 [Alphaproteobacteria bacterium 41-28]
MYNVAKIYFLRKYVGLFIAKNLGKRLFILFFFFMLQHYSVGYAMQETDESVEQQSTRRSVVKNRGEDLSTLSQEDEEVVPLFPVTRERNKSWKQSWFVKNVIVEFPIIGDFFHYDLSASDTIKRAGKSTSMLLGGSVGMMLDFIPVPNDDNMAAHITKGSINMAIGMWIAVTTYNTVLSLGNIVYQCFSTPHQSSQDTQTL